MSPFGDDVSEMDKFRRLSDSDIEALIAGQTPAGAEELDGVAGFARAAKAIAPDALDPAVEQLHLAAIVEAAQLMEAADTRLQGSTGTGRKTMFATLFASLWVKVAAGAVGVVLATGGLAAAHVLPGPVQDAVESVADQFGIDLSDDEADEDAAEEAEEAAEDAADAAEDAAEEAEEADEGDDESDDDADDGDDESDDDPGDDSDEADHESDDDSDDDSDEADHESDDDSDDDSDEADHESDDEGDDESDDDSHDGSDDESHDDSAETEESD